MTSKVDGEYVCTDVYFLWEKPAEKTNILPGWRIAAAVLLRQMPEPVQDAHLLQGDSSPLGAAPPPPLRGTLQRRHPHHPRPVAEKLQVAPV